MDRPVSEIMSRDLVVLEEWENLLDVAYDMNRHHLRHLPVVDGRRLVGLVSHRDLLRFTTSALDPAGATVLRDHNLKERTFVSEVMTRDVTTVRPDTLAGEAARMILDARFGCLPVVDDQGDLVGMVTEHDLLELLVEQLEHEREDEARIRRRDDTALGSAPSSGG